jgi:hypothetical protein
LLQVAKQLIFCSPRMKKVLFRIYYNLHATSLARDVRNNHAWFNELADAVGVRFCSITRGKLTSSTKLSEFDMEELE